MKVYHCGSKVDWKKPKDGNQTWEQYWEEHSNVKFDGVCRDCGKKTDDIVGAHVRKCGSDDMDVYIVPTCRGCNSSGGASNGKRVFDVSLDELVHANFKKLDEEIDDDDISEMKRIFHL